MIPEIGSKWKARDGRIMEVTNVVIPPRPDVMPWAHVRVLNATRRMRRETQFGTHNFNPGAFLEMVKE